MGGQPRYAKVPDLRKEGRISVNFVKKIFVIFNILFFATGFLLCGAAIWTFYRHHIPLILIKTVAFHLLIWLTFATGLLVILTSILGCFAVRSENTCIVAMFTFLMVVVFMSEIVIVLLSYVYQLQVGLDLKRNLNSVFQTYYSVEPQETKAIDELQTTLKCCGSEYYEDWFESVWFRTASKRNKVPDSCCKTPSVGCGVRDHPSNIQYTGCVHRLEDELQCHLGKILLLGFSCCVFEFFAFLVSTWLLGKLISLQKIIKRKRREEDQKRKMKKKNNSDFTNNVSYHPLYSNGHANPSNL